MTRSNTPAPASGDFAHSRLCTGVVMHERLKPRRHRLRYRIFSLLVDLDELPMLHQRLRLFSLDRFNLLSLRLSDFGTGDPQGPRGHIEQRLDAHGLPRGGPIRILAMPRVLGHAFNPLVVYFCHAADGQLSAILYEVNNTFGERHHYLIGVPPGQSPEQPIRQECDKQFHVSPFLPADMRYRFLVHPPATGSTRLSVGISVDDARGPVLHARLDAVAQPLSDGALLRTFFTHPLVTLKVVAGIHWEALRLWIKRVPVHTHPARATAAGSPSLPSTQSAPRRGHGTP